MNIVLTSVLVIIRLSPVLITQTMSLHFKSLSIEFETLNLKLN